MRKYFTLGLIGVLMIVLTQSAVPPLTRQAHAHKELPKWVTYEGKEKLKNETCRLTAWRCFVLPKDVCLSAGAHPTVCEKAAGLKLIDQLPVGFCEEPSPGGPEIPVGCTKFSSITVSYARCFPIYRILANGTSECDGFPQDSFCTATTVLLGPQWVCIPGLDIPGD